VSDLEKILGLKRESLYVTLHRMVKTGIFVRLRKNAYKLFVGETNLEKTANELYYPSYLSFESALSKYGVLSQIPYTLTFATTRPSNRIVLRDTEVEYRHLKSNLFFGYTLEHGMYLAVPEKALLDELYLVSRGKAKIDIEELDLREMDVKRLDEYAVKFPNYLGPFVAEVKGLAGTSPATLETKERIAWHESVAA
jgi:predicted transcriptional regulator of viral defense system